MLVGLWLGFLRSAFATSLGGVPAPGAFMVTAIFSGLAIAGGVAALRDVPIAVMLTGLISLLPVGLYLGMFPGVTRWIGVLDAALLAIGVSLMRGGAREDRGPGSDDLRPPPPE